MPAKERTLFGLFFYGLTGRTIRRDGSLITKRRKIKRETVISGERERNDRCQIESKEIRRSDLVVGKEPYNSCVVPIAVVE